MPIISQTKYAKHRGVSRQRINNWIRRGKLRKPAVVEQGGRRMIDRELADIQIAEERIELSKAGPHREILAQRLAKLEAETKTAEARAELAHIDIERRELNRLNKLAEEGLNELLLDAFSLSLQKNTDLIAETFKSLDNSDELFALYEHIRADAINIYSIDIQDPSITERYRIVERIKKAQGKRSKAGEADTKGSNADD